VPEREWERYQEIIVEAMLHPSFDWVDVPLSVETKKGPNWDQLEKINTFYSDE